LFQFIAKAAQFFISVALRVEVILPLGSFQQIKQPHAALQFGQTFICGQSLRTHAYVRQRAPRIAGIAINNDVKHVLISFVVRVVIKYPNQGRNSLRNSVSAHVLETTHTPFSCVKSSSQDRAVRMSRPGQSARTTKTALSRPVGNSLRTGTVSAFIARRII
jgi:hypothetical protein